MDSGYYIGGSVVTALGLVIGFMKHQLDKKGAVREILEKQLDQADKRNLDLEKENRNLTDQLIKRGRGKK